jgi:hypothetical protein
MTIQNQIATINSSMNFDNTGKYIRTEQGQVAERVNLRINSKDGQKYYNEKIKGNLLIQTLLPSGVNKTIGWCNDYKNNAILYFVYNSNEHHSVMRYTISTKAIDKLWYSESELGFEDTYLQAAAVDGMVYWVNGDQQPKSFHIERAEKFMRVLYGGETIDVSERYSILDKPYGDNIFHLIKTPPRFAPICEYDSDIAYNFNNLRKKLFQFKYAYVYKDNQISAWSPISKVPLPGNELASDGKFVDDITVNSYINITYNSGTNNVKSILVAARDTFPRNAGSFWQFEIIDKYDKITGERLLDDDGADLIPDNSDEDVLFYNNKYTGSIDTIVNNRYCDHVPLRGNDIILFDNKYLGIAYPRSGYDGITPDYSLTAIQEQIATEEEVQVRYKMIVKLSRLRIRGCPVYNTQSTDMLWLDIPSDFYPNSFYNISFSFPGYVTLHTFTIPTGATDAQYPRSVRDQFIEAMTDYFATNYPDIYLYAYPESDNSPRSIVIASAANPFGCNFFELHRPANFSGNVTSNLSETIPTSYKSLKRGQFHPFGIIYNDAFGRYNIVYGDQELYSPLFSGDPDDFNSRVIAHWVINHKPPDWATTYRFAYIRNKSYAYFQYFSYVKSTVGTGVETGNGIPDGKYFLEVNPSLQRIRDRFPNFIIPEYVWQNGDRIRVVGNDKSYEVLQEFTWITDESDPESGVTGILVDEPLTTHAPEDDESVGYIQLVEIYRQNPIPQTKVYQEIGEEYEIRTDEFGNKYHSVYNAIQHDESEAMGFTNQIFDANGLLVAPATGFLYNFGDVYVRQRAVIDPNDPNVIALPVIEDEYFNDYYISDSIDVGRVGAKIETKQKDLNRVVRSENFLENTEYNLLNVWLPAPQADFFEASDIYGQITGLQESGDVLKIIQEHKETSVYIGKIIAKESDGKDMYLESDRVFGTNRPYIEMRGSKYVNSIVSNDRNVFYYDDTTGELIRSAPNGQIAVSSEYHMGNWFEKKAKELREYVGNKDVIVSFDNDYNDVLISFIIGNTIETIVFYEKEGEKGFKHFALYKTDVKIPEMLAWYGDTHVSFMDGKLYLSNVGTLNTFYGQLQPCSLKLAINANPTSSKRYSNIWINSDKNIWDVEFTSENRVNYGLQKSILKPTVIEELNGRLHASMLKNMIDRDGTENYDLLYNGHDMVGEIMFVELSNNDDSAVTLGEVEVKFYINR